MGVTIHTWEGFHQQIFKKKELPVVVPQINEVGCLLGGRWTEFVFTFMSLDSYNQQAIPNMSEKNETENETRQALDRIRSEWVQMSVPKRNPKRDNSLKLHLFAIAFPV